MSSPDQLMLDLAARIRQAREASNLSQVELARKLRVSERTLQNWEAGTTFPQPSQRRKLARFLEQQAA
jgi:ribosome-binding protein aMBF1 (putative translation factor)